jgi:hypothetical protein
MMVVGVEAVAQALFWVLAQWLRPQINHNFQPPSTTIYFIKT